MRIVQVVEDDPTISQMYKLVLNRAGFDVVEAPSCLEAIIQFNEVVPDVMILDLALPDGDGLSILSQLNARPAYIKNSIIVISANADALERVNAAGIERFFQKPISTSKLIQSIEDCIMATSVAR